MSYPVSYRSRMSTLVEEAVEIYVGRYMLICRMVRFVTFYPCILESYAHD